MDLKEKKRNGGIRYRHPWELSRTQKLLNVFEKYLNLSASAKTGRKYINVGAGDLYFDKWLLKKYKRDTAYAVDLEYDETVPDYKRIKKFHYIEEISEKMDYAIMMDSLEYMEDDLAYVRKLADKVKSGGYLFFTLPAVSSLFSQHDTNVGNLRRYDIRTFKRLISKIPGLKIVEWHSFYTSLFIVRYLQVKLHLSIDKENKVTSDWHYSGNHFITRLLVWILDIDFMLNRKLSKAGIRIPGLSMVVVCHKA